ncbi:sunset domain-containing protein [Halalkalibacter akibai]|uniref:sunset domain-containing protein n=1 Tax=Halalkalibacter akibai TaxID=1411 RepID=UPI003F72A254
MDLEKQEPSKLANACDDPKIKGNHSSSGDLIYHIPGGQYYEKTNPEEMFCTEEEAKEAGYRKSMR